MSAIPMKCLRCEGVYFAGMVGTWMWPRHECPDGTTGAPCEMTTLDFSSTTGDVSSPPSPVSGAVRAVEETQ